MSSPEHHPNEALIKTENRLEEIIKHDPGHQRMGEVYKELDGLRRTDGAHFSKHLEQINNKLHKDGLLPDMTIVQDRYTGADHRQHTGFSLVAFNNNNPGHRVGTEVSTSDPRVAETPASQNYYRTMGHGRASSYSPGRDWAEGGRASHGGYDSHLNGQVMPEGERKEMIDKALELAGIAITPEAEAAMNDIIQRESGWDPNNVNLTDINAQRGDPSKGLMQVIHETFERFRDKSLPDSQLDPLANMVAALRYMGHRYGNGDNGAGLINVASRSGGY